MIVVIFVSSVSIYTLISSIVNLFKTAFAISTILLLGINFFLLYKKEALEEEQFMHSLRMPKVKTFNIYEKNDMFRMR